MLVRKFSDLTARKAYAVESTPSASGVRLCTLVTVPEIALSRSDIAEDTSTSPGADVIVSDRVVTTSWGAGYEFI